MALPADPDPDDPEQAIEDLLADSPLDIDDFRDKARERSQNVARGAQLALLQFVADGADNAGANGEDLDSYLAGLPAAIQDEWGDPDAARIGAIVEMTVQGAIGAASDAALSDPDSIEGAPYRAFLAVVDSSTSLICSACGEPPTVLHAGHPWWNGHSPPMHFGCRSWLVGLTKEQAQQLGITAAPPDVDADEGFGNAGYYWGYAPVETDYEVAARAVDGDLVQLWDPDQPRDADGKFGSGGGGSDGGKGGGGKKGDGGDKPSRGDVAKAAKHIERTLAEHGGVTWKPPNDTPKTGFMVSLAPGAGHGVVIDHTSAKEAHAAVKEWVRRELPFVRANADHYLGGWLDKSSSPAKVYLDVSQHFHDKGKAIEAGKSRNQIAIFHLDSMSEIATGGSGK